MDKMRACIFIICLSILVGFPAVYVFGEAGKRTYTYATKEDKTALIDEKSDSESYMEEKLPEIQASKETEKEVTNEEEKSILIEEENDSGFYTEKKLPETRIDEKTGKEIKIISSDHIPLVSEYRMKEEGE